MLQGLRRFLPVLGSAGALHSCHGNSWVDGRAAPGWPLVPLGKADQWHLPVSCAVAFNSWSPYARMWANLPQELKEELESRYITADPIGGDLAAKALQEDDIVDAIVTACPLHLPEDKRAKAPDYKALVRSLGEAAQGSKRARHLTPFEFQQASLGPPVEPSSIYQVRDWSSWRPAVVSSAGPQLQRNQDLAHKLKWSDRILNLLSPYWRSFPSLEDPTGKNKYELWRPLVGKTRGSTLEMVSRTLERAAKAKDFGVLWPLTENRVVHLLRQCQQMAVSSQRLSCLWRALNWLGDHFGCLVPKDCKDLQNRYDYVRTALVVIGFVKQKRAIAPPLEAVKALEERSINAPTSVDRFAASFFRWCIGCSARYSDTLHTQPSSFLETKDTVEFTAWQTKSVDAGAVHRPQPLIAPTTFFHSKLWWKELCDVTKARLKDPISSKDDYLLPCPNPSRTAFIPKPCSNAKAIRWLRALISTSSVQVDPEVVAKLTVSSFRVFMPNLAQKFLVDKERRQYLGRWSEADTADVYTREHRCVVSGIWREVAAKLAAEGDPDKGSTAPEELPVELAHPHYGLDEVVPEVPLPVFPLVTGKHSRVPKVPSFTPLKKPPSKEGRADYHLVVNSRKTGNPRVYRIHWFNDDLKCIGCGYQPARNQVNPFNEADWDPLNYDFCHKAALICAPPASFSKKPQELSAPLPEETDEDAMSDESGSSDKEAP